MAILGEKLSLRAYLRSTDQHHFSPIYERVVQLAAHHKLAGATVLRGTAGYGRRGFIEPSQWRLASPTPVVVEVVDDAARIVPFVTQVLPEIMRHGLVTLERAGVMLYRHRAAPQSAPRLELLGATRPLSTVPDIATGDVVKTTEDQVLLRIFIGEADHYEGQPLATAIMHKARELGLAGATVLQGSMGFGANSVLHTSKILVLSTDLPVVIELVDSAEKIELLLPCLETMVSEGMVTMEHVRVVIYRHNPADAAAKQ